MGRLWSLGLAILLAGCIGPPEGADPGDDEPLSAPGSPAPSAVAATPDGGAAPATSPPPADPRWRLDCTLGAYANGPWRQPCVARTTTSPGDKSEMWIGVNPTDPRNVVVAAKDLNPAKSAQCVWNGLSVTHDAGATWTEVTIGGLYADRVPTDPWWGFACNTDPMFAFAADGTLHYVVEMYNVYPPVQERLTFAPVGWRLVLATSDDGGLTWPRHTMMLHGDGVAMLNDYSRIAVSPATGSIVVAINTLTGLAYGACTVVVSRDGGQSADLPVRVGARPWLGPLEGAGYPCLTVSASPEGRLVIGTYDRSGQSWWYTSDDDGRSWSEGVAGFVLDPLPGRLGETAFRVGNNFEAAYDGSDGPLRGSLYAVFGDGSGGDADVLVVRSDDDGATWGAPVRVTSVSLNDQFMPNLAVVYDGSVHVFLMDRRWDPANRLIDITHAWSLDGGRTWSDERVTHLSWDGELGTHQDGAVFIGDYIGVAAAGAEVWAGFPDTSLGGPPVMAAARAVRDGAAPALGFPP